MKSCVEVFAFCIRENCIIPNNYLIQVPEHQNLTTACGYDYEMGIFDYEHKHLSACLSQEAKCEFFNGIAFFNDDGYGFIKCSCRQSLGNPLFEPVFEDAETLQSITYRAFELAESAIKAAIAQAIEEQFGS